MFKIISIFIWLIIIGVPLIWFSSNNGWITILWLGHEVKIDILTFIISLIVSLGIIFIIYRLFNIVISAILGIFGIFKTDQIKKRDKIIKKYEEIISLFTKYIESNNLKDAKESKKLQKQIISLSKDKKLKEAFSTKAPKNEITEKKKEKLIPKLKSKFRKIFTKNTPQDTPNSNN